jgi:hypothetical protein
MRAGKQAWRIMRSGAGKASSQESAAKGFKNIHRSTMR